jgi:arylsulfatase A-like enzyme
VESETAVTQQRILEPGGDRADRSARASRDRTPLAVLGLALAAFAGCGSDAQITPDPLARRETIQLDRKQIHARTVDDPGTAGAVPAVIVKESHDAVSAGFGESVVFPLRASGALEISAAFAARVPAGGSTERAGTIVRELRLRSGGRETVLATEERTLSDSNSSWSELRARVRVDPGVATDLVAVARWQGSEPMPADVAVLHAVPRAVAVRKQARNVLVISVDTLRADHLGFHGYERATSPRLDAFVARGTVFDAAISTSPWTLPAYGTLFTGMEPAHHRVGISARREAAFGEDNDAEGGDYQSLAEGVATLAGTFAQAGWFTGAIVANPHLDPGSGVDVGFDTFAQYLESAEVGAQLTERWIDARGETPWFLLVHFMDPHMPYAAPPPYDTQFARATWPASVEGSPKLMDLRAAEPDQRMKDHLFDAYDGEIAYTDAQIGRVLDFLRARGELDRTLVVVHADHGEEFWEHGDVGHGQSVHEELIHVPLAFVAPGLVAEGRRIPSRTSMVHVFATLLDLSGIPLPEGTDSVSLVPQLRPGGESAISMPARACISESTLYGPREQKSWSLGAEKFITDGAVHSSLYDLDADPLERDDTAGAQPDRVRELNTELRRRTRLLLERGLGQRSAEFDAERRAELERLGYPGADGADRK